eukprot:5306116-Alexandrium_andersonii.AAC.1
MSASLVGSEMCIRDRGMPREARRPCRASPKRRGAQRARPRKTSHLRPVSYTHLTLPTICSV